MERIAKSLMIRGPLSLMAITVGVYLTNSVFWGVMGLVVVWALVLLFYDLRSGIWIMDEVRKNQALLPEPVKGKKT